MDHIEKKTKMDNVDIKKSAVNCQEDEKPLCVKKVVTICLATFLTVAACIVFFFFIYRYHGFADSWKYLLHVMQPIIIGLTLAYLLNPVVNFCEVHAKKLLSPYVKNERRLAKITRWIGIIGSFLFIIIVIVLLIAIIVPSITSSVESIVKSLPDQIDATLLYIQKLTEGNSQLAYIVEEAATTISGYFENWFTDILIPAAQKYMTYISTVTSSVIGVFNTLLDIFVGIIVSVYVLFSKETFAGQGKKILYALFKPVRANVIIKTVRKSNEIFSGFITGKIIDSAIIGVLAYIVLSIMKMPDTVLVAVIIGVTNIIPFFGPFIGAIPSFIIIVLQNPMQGIYFLIFIVVLQQIDGNIIGPKILGNSTGLSSFWVVFAIMIFGGLWGFVGMLVGVPIMAVIYYVVHQIVAYVLKRRGIPESEIDYVSLKYINKYSNKPEYLAKKEENVRDTEGNGKKKFKLPNHLKKDK